ncbi:hypothetical protein [Herbiconiux daphne]|uniref:RDD domain-containing protein n=1 Tax=Herbiconiux daphne TaxID=2970914 RepID=A0ABT2H5N2_9MICO|nr:hypothetical protein [Herbiconiux daphne]MCS5735255.1 hypothetical protein [Herbiconiux daphne]
MGSDRDGRDRDGGRAGTELRRRFAAVLIVLAIDAVGVAAIAVAATRLAGRDRPSEAPLVAACTGVAFVTWLFAVVAVLLVRRATRAGLRRAAGLGSPDRLLRAARRWLWSGLIVNTVGSEWVAITALVRGDTFADVASGGAQGLLTATALAIGGVVVSLAYLLILPRRGPAGR